MRKVCWSCLSIEICAKSRNSSLTAQLQAPGAAKTGADVSPLGLASPASWAPGLLWSEDFGTGASLRCMLLLALCWQCYREWEECR